MKKEIKANLEILENNIGHRIWCLKNDKRILENALISMCKSNRNKVTKKALFLLSMLASTDDLSRAKWKFMQHEIDEEVERHS